MALNFLKAKTPEKVRKEKGFAEEIEMTPRPDKYQKAPWWVKFGVRSKVFLSELDPFRTLLLVTSFALVAFLVFAFLLPWIQVIQEVPNRWPILAMISGVTIGFFFSDFKNGTIRQSMCELSIGGLTYIVDNRKIDIYEGGEILYIINYYGKPIYNKEETNMRRYGVQSNIFVPKEVLSQFGSVLGRRAKAYPDCKLKTVWMREVDQGVIYIPRKLSETRLLKKIEIAEENLTVYHEMVERLKGDMVKIVSDMQGHEANLLKGLIDRMSSVQRAFYGTPEKIAQMVRQEVYRRGYSSYNRFRPYGMETGAPDWNEIAPAEDIDSLPPTTNKEEED
jgi:hypothetical protein